MRLLHLISLSALLIAPVAAFADNVNVSTGVTTYTYGYGVTDTAAEAATPSAALIETAHPAWVAAPGGTSWVGPTSNGINNVAGGFYDYATTFTLSSLTSVTLAGQFAADNTLEEILLNGNIIYAGGGDFSQLYSFGSNNASFFDLGTNTLQFILNNTGTSPSGLLVDATVTSFSGITPTPEPSSLALLGTGLFALAAINRRKFLQA